MKGILDSLFLMRRIFKMNSVKKVLVLGASGLVGRYVYEHLQKNNFEVFGTYHKHKTAGLIPFDIAFDNPDALPDAEYAVVCSAIAKIDSCESDIGFQTNVAGTERTLLSLLKRGIVPVFISGSVVFNGEGDYKEDDAKNPANAYGIQKTIVENFISSHFKDYLIARPGKIFGVKQGEGIFSEWIEKFKSGQEIKCARDEILSLTYAGDFARAILEMISRDLRGVFHINPSEYKSRLEFAREFFNHLHLDAKIQECSLDDFPFSEKRARRMYLDASKFGNLTGFRYTEPAICYDMIKQNFKR
jgi:dTDP-4-dehydrorhamnose reductase